MSENLACQHCDDDIEMTDVAGHYSGVCKKCRNKIDHEQGLVDIQHGVEPRDNSDANDPSWRGGGF